MELQVLFKLAHSKFHKIPWNCSCYRNWRTPSTIEFHGTAGVIEICPIDVPWNSMEFHVTAHVIAFGALLIPWNFKELLVSAKLAQFKFHGSPWISTELLVSAKLAHCKFHGIELFVSSKLAHPKFHGISWICSCHRIWRTPSSMEFHGTARVIEVVDGKW